jgi:hypothetical protein
MRGAGPTTRAAVRRCPLEFGLLTAEVGEASPAWRKRKVAKNSDRIDETDARGVLNRADHTPSPTELQRARSLGKLVACR